MYNYERVLKIIDLVKEIATSEELKTNILEILHDAKESICDNLDKAKEWVEEAANGED